MYDFGNPDDTADLLFAEQVATGGGPGLPKDKDEDDWGVEEIRAALIYASAALRRAYHSGYDDITCYSLCEIYEKYLVAYCELKDHIYNAMKAGEHNYPWPDPGSMQRQQNLVYRIYERRNSNKKSRKS